MSFTDIGVVYIAENDPKSMIVCNLTDIQITMNYQFIRNKPLCIFCLGIGYLMECSFKAFIFVRYLNITFYNTDMDNLVVWHDV